jgi:hypothetical protein
VSHLFCLQLVKPSLRPSYISLEEAVCSHQRDMLV